MPMSPTEQRRRAIQARWSRTTDPAQRRRETAPGRVSAAVKVLVDNWPELRPDQVAKLRSLLQQPGGGHDDAA
jgi:hypothetical protein